MTKYIVIYLFAWAFALLTVHMHWFPWNVVDIGNYDQFICVAWVMAFSYMLGYCFSILDRKENDHK